MSITPLQMFYYALAIVCAILSPTVALLVLGVVREAISGWFAYLNHRADLAAQAGPYDCVELRRCPNESMVEVLLYRNGDVVYRKSVNMPPSRTNYGPLRNFIQ